MTKASWPRTPLTLMTESAGRLPVFGREVEGGEAYIEGEAEEFGKRGRRGGDQLAVLPPRKESWPRPAPILPSPDRWSSLNFSPQHPNSCAELYQTPFPLEEHTNFDQDRKATNPVKIEHPQTVKSRYVSGISLVRFNLLVSVESSGGQRQPSQGPQAFSLRSCLLLMRPASLPVIQPLARWTLLRFAGYLLSNLNRRTDQITMNIYGQILWRIKQDTSKDPIYLLTIFTLLRAKHLYIRKDG